MPAWVCVDSVLWCQATRLCEGCLGRALTAGRGQARVLGEQWAEKVARAGHRDRESWPEGDPKALAIAARKVAQLAQDERLVAELARACSAGAAAWWQRRPARYR